MTASPVVQRLYKMPMQVQMDSILGPDKKWILPNQVVHAQKETGYLGYFSPMMQVYTFSYLTQCFDVWLGKRVDAGKIVKYGPGLNII